jgi:hypothetical protein
MDRGKYYDFICEHLKMPQPRSFMHGTIPTTIWPCPYCNDFDAGSLKIALDHILNYHPRTISRPYNIIGL